MEHAIHVGSCWDGYGHDMTVGIEPARTLSDGEPFMARAVLEIDGKTFDMDLVRLDALIDAITRTRETLRNL